MEAKEKLHLREPRRRYSAQGLAQRKLPALQAARRLVLAACPLVREVKVERLFYEFVVEPLKFQPLLRQEIACLA